MIKWRWIDISETCHWLVVDDGTPFGGDVLFKCGEIDSQLQDRIARLPAIEAALESRCNDVYEAMDRATTRPEGGDAGGR